MLGRPYDFWKPLSLIPEMIWPPSPLLLVRVRMVCACCALIVRLWGVGLSVVAITAVITMIVRLVESYNYLGGRLCACGSRPSVLPRKRGVVSSARCPCRASGARCAAPRAAALGAACCASRGHAAKAALPSVGTAVAPYGRGFLSAGALSVGCIGLPNFRQLRCSGPNCSINLESFRCAPSPCAQETVFDSSGRVAPSPTHHPELNNPKKT